MLLGSSYLPLSRTRTVRHEDEPPAGEATHDLTSETPVSGPIDCLTFPGRLCGTNRTPVRSERGGQPGNNPGTGRAEAAPRSWTTPPRTWMIGRGTWNRHGPIQTTTSSATTTKRTTTSCVCDLTRDPFRRNVVRVERSPEKPDPTLPPTPISTAVCAQDHSTNQTTQMSAVATASAHRGWWSAHRGVW